MNGIRYPEEFKIEAVQQVTIAGHSVAEVAGRLDSTTTVFTHGSNGTGLIQVNTVRRLRTFQRSDGYRRP